MTEAIESNEQRKYGSALCQLQLRYGADTWDPVSSRYGFFRTDERLAHFLESFHRVASDDRRLLGIHECR